MYCKMIKNNRYIVQNFGFITWDTIYTIVYQFVFSLNIKYNLEKKLFYSGI